MSKLTKKERLLHSLIGIKQLFNDLGAENLKNEIVLKDGTTETIDCYKEIETFVVDFINNEVDEAELKNIYLNKPYKLEDLKEDMWVYDIKYDEFCRIDFIAGIYPHRSYSDGTCEDGAFEENRFFPVQYANLIKMEVKEDG